MPNIPDDHARVALLPFKRWHLRAGEAIAMPLFNSALGILVVTHHDFPPAFNDAIDRGWIRLVEDGRGCYLTDAGDKQTYGNSHTPTKCARRILAVMRRMGVPPMETPFMPIFSDWFLVRHWRPEDYSNGVEEGIRRGWFALTSPDAPPYLTEAGAAEAYR